MQRAAFLWALIVFCLPALAQNTINFTGKVRLSDQIQSTNQFVRTFFGTGQVGALGTATVTLNLTQNNLSDDFSAGAGPVTGGLLLAFNSLDQIQMGFGGIPIPDPNFTTATVPGTVSANASQGVYAGAVSAGGAMRLTLTRTSTAPLRYNLSLTGSATVSGQSRSLTMADVPVTLAMTQVNLFDTQGGTCDIPALGSGTLTLRVHPDSNRWDESVRFLEMVFVCAFSASDNLRGFFIITPKDEKTFDFGPVTITGSTGRFAGAGGTAQLSNLVEGPGEAATLDIAGTIIEAGPTTPVVSSVTTAYWRPGPFVSQNDWIQIKGANLVPADTPAGGMYWSNAPEFAQGRMPTSLGGVSVTVNGKPAYVWWFCSKATTPSCAEDQINVLTPLDEYTGLVMVAVKNGAASSGAVLVNKVPTTPSILRFTARGDVVATHGDGKLLGPTTLYPGLSTPGGRGETVSLWTIGLGLPAAPLVPGSSTQTGALPYSPACFLGGEHADVAAALVSPGLYQLNVTIPNTAKAGDNPFYCTTPNNWTLPALIAIQ